MDDVDGDLPVSSTLPDLSLPGRHVIEYRCKNTRGGVAIAHRVVIMGPEVNAICLLLRYLVIAITAHSLLRSQLIVTTHLADRHA